MPGSIATPPTPTRRAGRPLDPRREAAILEAALDGLADLGYDRLTIDEIAARARAGKGAIYRRWSSKAELVVAAVAAWRDRVAPVGRIPDTGTLAGDLDALVGAMPDFDEPARRAFGVFVGLIGAAWRDPELLAAMAVLLERPRAVLEEVLGRAAARGELADRAPLELLPDVVMGLNVMLLVRGTVPDREFVARVVREVVLPLLTDGPAGSAATFSP